MIYVRRVQGKSLEPHYSSGQLLVCLRRPRVHRGDIALFEHEGRDKIKIVTDIDGDRVYLQGTTHYSTDSRDFGWINVSTVKGVVVWPHP